MAIKTAQANLTSVAKCYAITGFYYFNRGQLDRVTNSIKPIGRSYWGNVAGKTWATYKTWQQDFEPIWWTGPLMDNGEVRTFTIEIISEFTGTSIEYLVHASETGEFIGEETETLIQEGDLDIPAFYGRYFYVTARLNGRELRRMSIRATNTTSTIRLLNVNTSTLSGSAGARVLSLPRAVSGIQEMKIEVREATPYAVDLYVSSTATSKVLIPVVVSKTSTPTIGLYGIDNQPRDGIVDVTISATPRQVMANGSVYTIE